MTPVSVLTVTFEQDQQAYPAMMQLTQLDFQDQIKLRAAAVVVRDETGKVQIEHKVGGPEYAGAATGGMLGLLVGVLGGPLGMLLGGAAGLLLGGALDLEEDEDEGSVLAEISSRLRPRRDTLLAEVQEQSPEIIDGAMERLSGTVLRVPLAGVEAEVAYADEVHRQVRSEARRKLRAERERAHDQEVKAKLAALKVKLAHRRAPNPAGQQTKAVPENDSGPGEPVKTS